MGIVATGFQQAFRDFSTDGVPASGAHEVEKSEARALGSKIEQVIGLLAAGIPSYATAAALPTSPVPAAGTMARVYADPTPSNNVFWVYDGGWAIDTDLMTAITVQLSSDNTWTGIQSFEDDVFSGLARIGREGNNLRFGQNAVRLAATGQINIGIGDDTLGALTSGDRNVVVGSTSGQSVTSGSFNVLLGYSGYQLTSGSRNILIGAEAGKSLTSGDQHVAIGINTMLNATGGADCIAIGENALAARVNGAADVAIGKGAGQAITTGIGNVSVGSNANAACTTGTFNSAFGYESLVSNQTGSHNSAFANYALDGNRGSRNTGLGMEAGYRQRPGNDNLFSGYKAGRGDDATGDSSTVYYSVSESVILGAYAGHVVATGASGTVAIGFEAGKLLKTGANNTLVGHKAGDALTTGASNIIIGAGQDADSNTASDQINVGGRYFHDRIRLLERSSDPAEPTEGNCVVWMGDGTGKGDDGDVMIASKAGGVTKWAVLFDHSAGTAW